MKYNLVEYIYEDGVMFWGVSREDMKDILKFNLT